MNSRNLAILRDYLIGWFFATLIWELLRNTDQIDPLVLNSPFSDRITLFVAVWLSQGLFFGSLFVFIEKYIKGSVSYTRFLIITLALQIFVSIIILLFVFYLLRNLGTFGFTTPLADFLQLPSIPVSFIFSILTNFAISMTIQVNLMLGNGKLLKVIRGSFYKPKVGERIFMFLDLRSSTTIAENIGHIMYSKLIQDCFRDLELVHDYKADIYQYVGDEAVLVWNIQDGKKSLNCIQAFFAFKNRIAKRGKYYMSAYGVIPEFKAGMNLGSVTIAEVGVQKREIAYHGDTINTAARIQGECNELNTDFLVSEDMVQQLQLDQYTKNELKGKIELKGKRKAVNVYSVTEVTQV